MTQDKYNWQKKFDEKFGYLYRNISKTWRPVWIRQNQEVRYFISSLLQRVIDDIPDVEILPARYGNFKEIMKLDGIKQTFRSKYLNK